jgi:hypothetical protein
MYVNFVQINNRNAYKNGLFRNYFEVHISSY